MKYAITFRELFALLEKQGNPIEQILDFEIEIGIRDQYANHCFVGVQNDYPHMFSGYPAQYGNEAVPGRVRLQGYTKTEAFRQVRKAEGAK